MDYDKVLSAAYSAVLEQKGEDPVIFGPTGINGRDRLFLITTGRNPNHLKAMADRVLEDLGALGFDSRSPGR